MIDIVSLVVSLLFGVFGIGGSILTGKRLNDIRKATKNLNDGISNLEDATRRTLSGFHEIFARAIWLLDKSTREETYYINFVLAFGAAHVTNQKVIKPFSEEITRDRIAKVIADNGGQTNDFSGALVAYKELLRKVATKPNASFNALLLNEDSVENEFLSKLESRYKDGPAFPLKGILSQELSYRKQFLHSIKGANVTSYFRLRDTLPMQFLITKIKGEQSGGKWGCLVFFIGSSNIESVEPRGYYTELDHMANLHIQHIKELTEAVKPIDIDDWLTRLNGRLSEVSDGD